MNKIIGFLYGMILLGGNFVIILSYDDVSLWILIIAFIFWNSIFISWAFVFFTDIKQRREGQYERES